MLTLYRHIQLTNVNDLAKFSKVFKSISKRVKGHAAGGQTKLVVLSMDKPEVWLLCTHKDYNKLDASIVWM